MIEKKIYPTYLDNSNFRYAIVDNILIASLIISDYPRNAKFMQILEALPKNIKYDMSIHVKKQDTKQVLKDITYSIANTLSEINTINKNQLDIDILDKTKTDAERLRYDIQINNEEIYKVYIILTIYIVCEEGDTKLFSILKTIESSLYSKQLSTKYANFRQIQAYTSTLPLNTVAAELVINNSRNFTTSSVANIYPFCTENMFDKEGIMFGTDSITKKICNIDIFNKNYLNANMCVFGSTGSGKSYYIKLSIIRNHIMGVEQYVFDPEGEYFSVCSNLEGNYISYTKCKSCINILDISDDYLIAYKEEFLKNKISKVLSIIEILISIDDTEKQILYDCVIKAYLKKGITYEISSMYEKDFENKILIEKKLKIKDRVPNLYDVYNEISEYYNNCKKGIEKNKCKDLINKFKESVLEKIPFLSNTTNCEYNKSLVVYDLSNINNFLASLYIKYIIDEIKLKLKNNSSIEKKIYTNTIIYIDEIWKYVGSCGNYELSQEVFSLFKTIRKLNASIITITQDIQDFFEYEKGIYGKSILNNTGFKMIFKIEYMDAIFFRDLGIGDTKVLEEIYKLDKGQAILVFKNNYIKLNIKANEIEERMIQGGKIIENSSSIRQ